MSRILVCGGRDYRDADAVFATLDAINAVQPITQIIEGGATGADRLALAWAIKRKVEVKTFCAEWTLNGRAAGPIRNRKMLDEGKPDKVVAFPGGRGTANMVEQAKSAGVPVALYLNVESAI
jgi:hypothetical protein